MRSEGLALAGWIAIAHFAAASTASPDDGFFGGDEILGTLSREGMRLGELSGATRSCKEQTGPITGSDGCRIRLSRAGPCDAQIVPHEAARSVWPPFGS